MVEAESFLMKSRVRSIWPQFRAGWFAEVLERDVSRGATFGVAVSANHVFLVYHWWPQCSCYRSLGLFALESRAHSGARSVVPARRQLVFLRNRLSALRVRPGWSQDRAFGVGRPHAVGGRVNCAAWLSSRLVEGCRRFQVASLVLAI